MHAQRLLHTSDFITGLIAGLALENVHVLSLRNNRFDRAMERLFEDLKKEATEQGLNIRFRIRTHPVHGDSVLIQQALYEAAQRDLVSLDNPEFQDIRLKISSDEAPSYLNNVPGSPEMYQRLAKLLIEYYQETAAS